MECLQQQVLYVSLCGDGKRKLKCASWLAESFLSVHDPPLVLPIRLVNDAK